jgi:hypothetical protein
MKMKTEGPSLRHKAASPPDRGRTPPVRRRRGGPFLLAALLLSGCVNIAMTCPDKVSTVSYKGIALTGTNSVSCMPALNGGYDIEVGGMNLLALAAAVAPLVAAKQPHAAAAEPDPDPLLPPSSTYNF